MIVEFHPIANVFPLIEGDDFDRLVDDIRNNGLLESIWLYENKILDGRNRYNACLASETRPKFREYRGDNPLAFVVSLNLERRHLTPSQRACLAIDILPFYKHAAKERQKETQFGGGGIISTTANGKSRDFVAEIFNVNSRYVQDAETLNKEAPELFQEARAGLLHMKEAMRELKQSKREAEREKLRRAGELVEASKRWHVYHGDIETWKAPRRYDFIITDPPYPEKYLYLYEVLSRRAAEWLKPGGLLIAMSAHYYLPEIYKRLDEHLHYFWTSSYLVPGKTAGVFQKHINTQWKPLIMYERKDAPYHGRAFADVFKSEKRDKDHHGWGQSESGMLDIVSKICTPGQYILDPFCGAGTTLVSGLAYGCLVDGLDLDLDSVNISKARLNEQI